MKLHLYRSTCWLEDANLPAQEQTFDEYIEGFTIFFRQFFDALPLLEQKLEGKCARGESGKWSRAVHAKSLHSTKRSTSDKGQSRFYVKHETEQTVT